MIISADLFRSDELRAWTLDNKVTGHCEVSGSVVSLIDTTQLSDFFSALFSLFDEDAEGRRLADVIQQDWALFVDNHSPEEILPVLLSEFRVPLTVDSKVKYKVSVTEPCARWMDIKQALKTERRFFAGDLIQEEDKWDVFFASNYTIKAGTLFKRARINDDEKKLYSTKSEMGMPPTDKAPAGRANTYGIPYLYLGEDDQTVMYESRAVVNDILSIASFSITADLDVVDFTYRPDLFGVYQQSEDDFMAEVQRYVFLNEVARDLSKAVRRYDNKEIDYLPTQFVCEYIRLVTAANGLIFQSAQYPKGKNIVLFNDNNAVFEGVVHKVVGSVKMEFAM